MSFARLIYWSGLLGGWSAFVAWLFCEVIFGRWIDDTGIPKIAATLVVVMGTLVGAAIGGGISQAAGLVNFRLQEQLLRLGFGLVGGLIGGLVGTLFAVLLFAGLQGITENRIVLFILSFFGRLIGLTFLGAVVGVVEGVYDRSFRKIRNGIIGGALGGFLGGLLFTPLSYFIGNISGRAIAFVLLGLFVGVLVGLVQVLLKEAWLTVEGGFRTGRQLILSRDETTMGTSEKAGLIFIAYGAKGVEPIHVRIVKQSDGRYVVQDNASREGTYLNGARLQASAVLQSGDVVQFGVNVVRFNERFKRAGSADQRPLPAPTAATRAPEPVVVAAVKAGPPPGPPPQAVTAKVPVSAAAIAPAIRPAVAPAPAPAAAPAAAPVVAPPPSVCPVCGSRDFATQAGVRRCRNCFSVVS